MKFTLTLIIVLWATQLHAQLIPKGVVNVSTKQGFVFKLNKKTGSQDPVAGDKVNIAGTLTVDYVPDGKTTWLRIETSDLGIWMNRVKSSNLKVNETGIQVYFIDCIDLKSRPTSWIIQYKNGKIYKASIIIDNPDGVVTYE